MNEQETALIIHAIELGLRIGGADSKREEVAGAFRTLRTVLFDCFWSEYKPGVDILLEYLKSPESSSRQLVAAIRVLGKYRKSEIIIGAQQLISLAAMRDSTSRGVIEDF